MPIVHLYVFFGKLPIHVLCPFLIGLAFFFFFLLLSCMSSLCILDINFLLNILFLPPGKELITHSGQRVDTFCSFHKQTQKNEWNFWHLGIETVIPENIY